MVVKRDIPFEQFNFLVDLGTGQADGPDAGFQECSILGMEVTVAEYRSGNESENSLRITGPNKATDVTLKRGVCSSGALYSWLDAIRDGDQNEPRTVRIQLKSEDHQMTVLTWVLKEARIVKYVSDPLNAKETDVMIEELTFACEHIELEDDS